MMFKKSLLAVAAALLALPVVASDSQTIPPGGKSVLPSKGAKALSMGDPSPLGDTSWIKVKGMPFTDAIRTHGKKQADNLWDFQLFVKNGKPVAKGDVLLASFWMRCERSRQESGTGRTAFGFQRNGEPWTTSVEQPATAGNQWQQFFVAFESKEDYQPEEALIFFRLGYEPQTLDIGGLQVLNYGKSRTVAELPRTRLTYKGMEEGAAWRDQAAKRILRYRMADLTVKVLDKKGRPVKGANVDLVQGRSAFHFGTAVSSEGVLENSSWDPADLENYQKAVTTWFNAAVLENALKWPPIDGDWGGDWGWDRAVEAVNWINRKGLYQRGHVLFWPSWRNSPKALEKLKDDPAALRAAILERIEDAAGGMQGQLQEWDVVNEPFDNHDVTDILGKDSLVDWFKAAAKADPAARLFLNDYGILSGGPGDTGHRRHFEETAQFLLEKGAPLHGLGFQGHFDAALTPPEYLEGLLDRYGKYGLPLLVTEYDNVIDDAELAGRYFEDFLTMMYSHPAVEGVVLWGFWDGAHWKKNAPLFNKDWSLKPAGSVWKKLVLGEWKTQLSQTTDESGTFRVKAHLGRYVARAKKGRKEAQGRAELRQGGAELVINLK